MFFILWYLVPVFLYPVLRRQRPGRKLMIGGATMFAGWLLLLAHSAVGDSSTSAGGSDTGLALLPVTGVPLTAVWYGFVFLFLGFADVLLGRREKERETSEVDLKNN